MTKLTKAELIKARRVLLRDTIRHFNSENRGYSARKQCCVYSHKCNGGCAIGRKIPQALAKRLDRLGSGVGDDCIFDSLPPRLRRLGQDFLKNVQTLHDEENNWDTEGLTDHGRCAAKDIRQRFLK